MKKLIFLTIFGTMAAYSQDTTYIYVSTYGKIVRFTDWDFNNWQVFSYNQEFLLNLAIDSSGHIYSTTRTKIIRVDDIDGSGLVAYGDSGSGIGEFLLIIGITIDTDGRIYLGDGGNFRIVKIDNIWGDGWDVASITYDDRLRTFIAGGRITISPSGTLYWLSPYSLSRLLRWHSDSAEIETFGYYPPDSGIFYDDGYDLFIDNEGRIYVACGEQHKIVRMDNFYGDGFTEYYFETFCPTTIFVDSCGKIYVGGFPRFPPEYGDFGVFKVLDDFYDPFPEEYGTYDAYLDTGVFGQPFKLILYTVHHEPDTDYVKPDATPKRYEIYAHPNPFNSTVRIELSQPAEIVSIYSAAGQKIGEFHNRKAVLWKPAPTIPSGIYIVEAKYKTATRTARIMYIK